MAVKSNKSGFSAIDLAKNVMRTAHAGGGATNLHAMAQKVQAQGRNGDTILAHINPHEAAMLKHMGGSGKINPSTGLMSFNEFDAAGPGETTTTTSDPTEKDYIAALDKIFRGVFRRPFDKTKDSYWLDQLKSKEQSLDDLGKLEQDIKSGASGIDKATLQYAPKLQELYQQYFGRDYNPDTDSYWIDQLASGKEKPENLAKDILSGASFRDKMYYNTYNTPQQTQAVNPVQQLPSGYMGNLWEASYLQPSVGTTTVQPTIQQNGTATYVPSGEMQNYGDTPWNMNDLSNYMMPSNPMLNYQFNAPNLISAPLLQQHLANSGGAGVNMPTEVTPVGTGSMDAYVQAYNDVMKKTKPVDKTVVTPDKTVVTPDKTVVTPDTTIVTPDGSGTKTNVTNPSTSDYTGGKPNVKQFMDATGADFQTASMMLYGVVGANTDTRNWNAIMSSKDPVAASQTATKQMYEDPNQATPKGYTNVNTGTVPDGTITNQSGHYVTITPPDVTDPKTGVVTKGTPYLEMVSSSGTPLTMYSPDTAKYFGFGDPSAAAKASLTPQTSGAPPPVAAIPAPVAAQRGGAIKGKKPKTTGAFIKKALMIVSQNRPKSRQRQG